MELLTYVAQPIGERGMRNKNNVRKNADDYKKWLGKHEGYDPASLEGVADVLSPFGTIPMAPLLEDKYEALENLYHGGKLKGRQKQIVKLLFEGILEQVDIAKRLSMRPEHVTHELRKIMKKIEDNIA